MLWDCKGVFHVLFIHLFIWVQFFFIWSDILGRILSRALTKRNITLLNWCCIWKCNSDSMIVTTMLCFESCSHQYLLYLGYTPLEYFSSVLLRLSKLQKTFCLILKWGREIWVELYLDSTLIGDSLLENFSNGGPWQQQLKTYNRCP